jgi:phosphatidylinositol alpha 1,6-mannosyltransferase
VMHIAFPMLLGSSALRFARVIGVPAVASMHTRFETYPRYYKMRWAEPFLQWVLGRFYRQCDAVVAPNETSARIMREQGMGEHIGIWARGIDTSIFNPGQRSQAWRAQLGFGPDDIVIGYLGRLVLEKGLDIFAATVARLKERGIAHRVLIVGDGPARTWLQKQLADAVFTGFLSGEALGQATASMDIMLNPSTTEAFGNVMLEGLASGIPVVAARASGGETLIEDGVNGRLIEPGRVDDFADAVASYCTNAPLRAAHGQAALASSAQFDWDRVNHAMIDTYLRVVRDKG